MRPPFTIGIEEEFQMVDRQTGQLSPRIEAVLERGHPLFGEHIKAEMLQPTVELISDILADIQTARRACGQARATLAQLLAEEGLALVSAGTHPTAMWQETPKTPYQRYVELEDEFQDVARSILIFGLHVHIGVETRRAAVLLMNQLRTWLPHLLALSTNSPFWEGRMTGLKSYRSVIWRPFPRTGVPEVFLTWEDFTSYEQRLIETGCIDNGKRIWWDLRPHPFFTTLEFRICDMPATFDDTLAIAALCQALVAKVSWLNQREEILPMLSSDFIDENKWHVIRSGLDAEVVDFVRGLRLPMRQSIHDLLDFVDDVAGDLGSRGEIDYLRNLIESEQGTGADRQMARYRQTGRTDEVMRLLMQQTMQGIPAPLA
jgi:glutamate---cysteine ligase / carboxylate-amine ligase